MRWPKGRWAPTTAARPSTRPPSPSPDPSPLPPWGPYPLSDIAELAAEISTVDGMALAEARALAQAHLQRVTHGAGPLCTNCGNYGHMAIDCPYPALPLPKPRPRGPRPIICGALLAEADRVLSARALCGDVHHIQQCGKIRARLFAPELAWFEVAA